MIKQAELLWERIIERGSNLDFNFKEALNKQPCATVENFQLIESTIGVYLPEEMKSFYSVYNGQVWDIGVEPFVRNLTLSPIWKSLITGSFYRKNLIPTIYCLILSMMLRLNRFSGIKSGFQLPEMEAEIIFVSIQIQQRLEYLDK